MIAGTLHAQDVWKAYTFEKVNCSAMFPAAPMTAQEDNVWTAQTKSEGVIYQIVVYLNKQYTKNDVEAVLKESTEGFINPATDQIIKQEKLQQGGLPALQIQVKSQDGTFLVFRTIVGTNKLYQIAIAGTNQAQTLAKAQKFLENFKP